MGNTDSRIDDYIARSAEFARPILKHVRALVHEVCPQIEETIKWGMPTFVHAGGILCGMAAFKQHVSFGFWKHDELLGVSEPRDGMGSFGKLAKVSDLPPKKTLVALIRKAIKLNEAIAEGSAPRRAAKAVRPPAETPADLSAALKRNAAARKTFEGFSPSQRREYIEWITEAKRDDTRQRRLAQTLEWLAEGKQRNWKYQCD